MGGFTRSALIFTFVLLVGGCSVETRSIVDTEALPAAKYRHIAVFVEKLDSANQAAGEQIIASALANTGIRAETQTEIFSDHGNLSPADQARLLQTEGFDAVLYVDVLEDGYLPESVNTASWNAPGIRLVVSGPRPAEWALKTKADLQGTHTDKLVWTAETVATGVQNVTTMRQLFDQVAKQIVSKMREDKAI